MMVAPPDVSIVVPCHNEVGNLLPLIAAIRDAVGRLDVTYEIVITDDASTDGSWDVLQDMARRDRRVRVQRFARNCGESAASWAGMQVAEGRRLVTLDADLQNDPADIPRFLAALEDADCVCGTRAGTRADGDGWLRVVSSRIANWVRMRLSGDDVTDAGCTYRAFRRECIANVYFFKGCHRFLPTLVAMDGFRVMEIAVRNHPRRSGRSHYGVWNRLFRSSADLLAVRWMKSRSVRYEIDAAINLPRAQAGARSEGGVHRPSPSPP
jgi:glycosyltransferase involved in cell wall biosynthesis